jgi:phosphoribosyl 1,2-cyclic phosphodiesterase
MAKLKCLSSGSSGNSYILKCNRERLLLELGVKWNDILRGLDYDLSNVTACIVSHIHNDHSKSVPNALKSGLSVYSCQGVANTYKGTKVLPVGVKTKIGGFKVQPLPLKHNVENYGFIITTADNNKIVFSTDAAEFRYKIKGVHHWIIECNHCEELMLEHALNNVYSMSASENHLEIKQTIDVLKNNFCVDTQTIVLCHLSQGNADEKEFAQRVKNELAFSNVYVAKPNLEIELNKSEF